MDTNIPHWKLFQPLPVLMISTLDSTGFTRCSPFSWVLPLNKKSGFAVMMRVTSRTLANVKKYPYFTMSWMKPTPEVAQSVLMATRGPNGINLVSHPTLMTEFKYPQDALVVANAKQISIQSLAGLEPVTHQLVLCELLSWFPVDEAEYFSPLLHFEGKTFAQPNKFTVKGY